MTKNNKMTVRPADAQADLILRWAHSHSVGFVMSRLILCNHPNLHLVYTYAFIKFDRNPWINSQEIEHKQNSDVDQGP